MKKIRVCVLFGGKSEEHDVSVNSAASVVSNLDPLKYDVLPVAISREGRWLPPGKSLRYLADGAKKEFTLSISKRDEAVDLQRSLVVFESVTSPIDVVFPVLHGPYGEDGTLQGFLELVGVPFVGSDTLASALAMDKLMAKKIFIVEKIPTPPYWFFRRGDTRESAKVSIPCVVKPMNSGSSVGIAIVKKRSEFLSALRTALQADRKGEALVEKFISGREITVPVLGEEVLPVVEIRPKKKGAWFNYEVKYNSDLVDEIVPAPLSFSVTKRAQELALRAHHALKCRHISRTDMIIEEKTGKPYVLEVNTMPGMTSASLLPKAAKAAGISFPDLLDRLIQMALQTRN
ncbi:MAG: D-alanine--D-alanine ligase family protein [Nanoarchaeota archaeon]|nr:D-alanine--D-alanine ligase family protein [Nanoarchaeota archaeon]